MVTDFGLAKDLSEKYSRNTNTTRAVGRFWFTDPLQFGALKDGSFNTDLYSLAKTIDYIFNGDQTQRPHKYSAVVHKATAPDQDARYSDISELKSDVLSIVGRHEYQSTREIIADMLQKYKETHEFDEMRLAHILSDNHDEDFMWSLIVTFENQLAAPFVSLSRTNYELCVSALKQLNRSIEIFRPWTEYDTVAYWAAKVLQGRPNADDALSVEAAQLIEYVSSRANRYDIQRLANRLKNDTTIDSHIRALLTYHDVY